MKKWKIRRHSLLVGALVILVILLGIHVASDLSIGGFGIGFGVDSHDDTSSFAGAPSNQRLDTTPPVATSILSATSILGHTTDIYLDGTLPVLN